jgi:hypothetical protein
MTTDDVKRPRVVRHEDVAVLEVGAFTMTDVEEEFLEAVNEEEEASEENKAEYDLLLGLSFKEIQAGKERELNSLLEHEVYERVLLKDAVGGRTIGTRWVLRARGSVCKAHIVLQGARHGKPEAELYSPTPPLSSLRLLLSHASAHAKEVCRWAVRTAEVQTEFLNALVPNEEVIFVRPPTCTRDYQEGFLWRLRRRMCRLHQAPRAWYFHLQALLMAEGFERSRADPGVYHNKATHAMLLVHDDEIIISARDNAIDRLFAALSKSVILCQSESLLFPSSGPIEFLGRTLSRKDTRFFHSGDAGLISMSAEELGLTNCQSPMTPSLLRTDDNSEKLDTGGIAVYRKHTGRLMCVAQDRPDVQFAVKSLARCMCNPSEDDMAACKRVIRYLSSRKVLTYEFDVSIDEFLTPTAQVDSDWAGCRKTRRSTSGGIVALGNALIFHWSKTQSTVALSSCEAELNSITTGVAEGLFLRSLLVEQGFSPHKLVICSNSQAALDGLVRGEVGRLKHVSIAALYLEELVKRKHVVLKKVDDVENPAHVLTKSLREKVLVGLLARLPLIICEGGEENNNDLAG